MGESRFISTYNRGKVSDNYFACIQNNSPFLEDELEPQDIVTHLFSKTVLSNDDREDILGKKTRKDKTRQLLSTIINRTDKGFEIFLEVLETTGHTRAAETIKKWLSLHTCDSSEDKFEENVDKKSETESNTETSEGSKEEKLCELEGRVVTLENNVHELDTHVTEIAWVSSQHIEAEADELRRQLAEAKEEIKRLKKQLADKSRDLAKAQAEIVKLESRIKMLIKDKERLARTVARQDERLTEQEKTTKIQKEYIKRLAIKVQEVKKQSTEEVKELREMMKKKEEEDAEERNELVKKVQALAERLQNPDNDVRGKTNNVGQKKRQDRLRTTDAEQKKQTGPNPLRNSLPSEQPRLGIPQRVSRLQSSNLPTSSSQGHKPGTLPKLTPAMKHNNTQK